MLQVASKELGLSIACLDLGPVPQGRMGSSFLAIGGYDTTVRILSLEQATLLTQRSMLQLSQRAESLCLVEMAKEGETHSSLFLNIGLTNGIMQVLPLLAPSREPGPRNPTGLLTIVACPVPVLVPCCCCQRLVVDPLEGTLSDSRQRFLGALPVKLHLVNLESGPAVLALSSRSWLAYNHQVSQLRQTHGISDTWLTLLS